MSIRPNSLSHIPLRLLLRSPLTALQPRPLISLHKILVDRQKLDHISDPTRIAPYGRRRCMLPTFQRPVCHSPNLDLNPFHPCRYHWSRLQLCIGQPVRDNACNARRLHKLPYILLSCLRIIMYGIYSRKTASRRIAYNQTPRFVHHPILLQMWA